MSLLGGEGNGGGGGWYMSKGGVARRTLTLRVLVVIIPSLQSVQYVRMSWTCEREGKGDTWHMVRNSQ